MARRSRLRSFLSAFEQLPPSHLAAEQPLVARTLTEHVGGTDGSYRSRDELAEAVDATRTALAKLQTASLRLELAAASSAGGAVAGGAMTGTAEDAADKHLALPHRQPAASGAAETPAATPTPSAPVPADDDEDKPPDVLTEEQRTTLTSLRTSHALEALPRLWELLPRDGSREDVPLQSVLDAAMLLSDGDPWRRLRFHLRLARAVQTDEVPAAGVGGARISLEQLRGAAAATAADAFSMTRALLLKSDMLSATERERLEALDKEKLGAAATLTAELRRRTRVQRVWHRLQGNSAAESAARDGRETLEAILAADRNEVALCAAMENDASLHKGLMQALFHHHDRLATRRRRRVNAVKGVGGFFALQLVDFALTNS